MRKPKQRKPPLNDLSRSLATLDVNHTLIAVIIPGVERPPLKKLEPGEDALLNLLDRWRTEAEKAGHKIERIAVAFEAGRDGFWLARWLRVHGIEAHVIHAASVACMNVASEIITATNHGSRSPAVDRLWLSLVSVIEGGSLIVPLRWAPPTCPARHKRRAPRQKRSSPEPAARLLRNFQLRFQAVAN
jgi:hypothetical protein